MANVDDWEDVPLAPAKVDDWQDVPLAPDPKAVSFGEAVMRGGAQGISGGFIDELTAAVGGAKDAITGPLGFKEAYGGWRDAIRRRDKRAADEQKAGYIGGALLGGAGTTAVVAPLAAAGNTLKGAAGLGAATGFGSSEGDLLKPSAEEFGTLAKDTLLGGLLGGGAQQITSRAIPAAINKLKGGAAPVKALANERSAKAALGNNKTAWEQIKRKPGGVQEFGDSLLENDVMKFGSNAQGIADNAGEVRAKAWDKIEKLITQADADGATVSLPDTGKRLTNWASSQMDETADANSIDKVLDIAGSFENRGNVPLSQAQQMRGRWKFDPRDPQKLPVSKEISNKVYMELGDGMEDAFERYAAQAPAKTADGFGEVLNTGSGRTVPRFKEGAPVLKEATETGFDPKSALAEYKAAKKLYGNMASGEDFAEFMANRESKNRAFSLTDHLMGLANFMANPGEGIKGVAKGVAAAAGNKVMRERGNSALAVTLDKASKMLENSPQTLGPYADILRKAASRGSLGVVHSLLMNEPDYAARMAAP